VHDLNVMPCGLHVKVSMSQHPKFLWHFCVKEKEKEMKIIEQKHKGKIIFKKDY